MSSEDLRKIAENWVEHTRNFAKEGAASDSSAYELDDLCQSDPSSALEVILIITRSYSLEQICNENKTDASHILSNLAAGPLEDLLVYHGKSIIYQIETEARLDQRFIWLLENVWENRIDKEVWRKIKSLGMHLTGK